MRLFSSIDQHVKTNVSRSMNPYPPGILTNASVGVRRNDCLEAKKEANNPAFNKKSIATGCDPRQNQGLDKTRRESRIQFPSTSEGVCSMSPSSGDTVKPGHRRLRPSQI